MKTVLIATTAALAFATGAVAGQDNSVDQIEKELIRSGQLELAAQYDSFTEAQKRQLLRNESPWVRAATRNWIWSLYD